MAKKRKPQSEKPAMAAIMQYQCMWRRRHQRNISGVSKTACGEIMKSAKRKWRKNNGSYGGSMWRRRSMREAANKLRRQCGGGGRRHLASGVC